MVEAAYRLFSAGGYGVPMSEIAAEGGVAVQTLYFTFHTKLALLGEALQLAVLGDDQPLAPHQRPWFAELDAEPNPRKAMAIMVASTEAIFGRVAPLVGIFQSGDPELAGMWEHSETLRWEGYRNHVINAFARKGAIREGLGLEGAADVLFVLLGPVMYEQLVLRRGWSKERWRDWITATLGDALFGPE
jgi:AcrR family transcriptional regulator